MVSANTNVDRITARRQATVTEVVAAAWDLVRTHGLAGLSMRDLGKQVGMRAQSLYSYFGSKHEIYDAMFAEGNRAFVEWMREAPNAAQLERDPVTAAHAMSHRYFEFCTSDPVRYQLLFQRTIPEFVPSERSYAIAQEAYELALERLGAIGITGSGVDLWTALMTGLVDQQLSNDPGGRRWAQLVDRATDMLLAELAPQTLAMDQTRSKR